MRLLLNLIWLVFGGLVMALGYAVVALVMFVLIVTIPFGIASARVALFCLCPFRTHACQATRRRWRVAAREHHLDRAGRVVAGPWARGHWATHVPDHLGHPAGLGQLQADSVSLFAMAQTRIQR